MIKNQKRKNDKLILIKKLNGGVLVIEKDYDKVERLIAEETLKHLFVGASVDGMKFGLSSKITKIYFTHYNRNSDKDSIFLNIESKWSKRYSFFSGFRTRNDGYD